MSSNVTKPTPGWPEGKSPATLDDFYRCLEASRILTAEEARQFIAGLTSAKPPDTPKATAIELIKAGKLTRHQGQAILQGRVKFLSFGDYIILDKLGQGGMGQVLKAEHRRMRRTVALKVIAASEVKDVAAVRRFQREVHAAARLIHSNIVTAFDANEHEGVHFLVMEYVEGRDLAAIVGNHGPLAVNTAVDYVLQAARGLAYAHSKGVVHRDIKPGNLLVDREGTVKILDMGLARLDHAAAGDELTSTGQVMGTVDYMAPEQAEDTHTADARADIYSLGCTLYRLLSGDVMYSGESVIKRLLSHRTAPIPSLASVCPSAPAALDATFRKMVAKRPEERQQTMTEVVAELEGILRGTGPTAPSSAPQEVTTDSKLSEFFAGLNSRGGKSSPTATAQKAATKVSAANEVTQDFRAGDTNPTGLTAHLGSAAFSKPEAAPTAAPAPAPPKKRRSWLARNPIAGLIAAACGGLALAAAGIVVFLPAGDGTIRVEVNDPSIEVTVSGSGYKIRGKAEEIHVKPGEHTLHVKTGELEFDTNKFVLGKGENPPLKVELLPGKVQVVRNNGKLLGEKSRPPEKSAGSSSGTDYALKFDEGTKVQLPGIRLDPSGPFTIEAYFTQQRRIDLPPGQWASTIYSINRLGLTNGDAWGMKIIGRDGSNLAHVLEHRPIVLGQRTHIAGVSTGRQIYLFVDGVLVQSKDLRSDPPAQVDAPLEMGWAFAGNMDEIRISNVARYDRNFTPRARFEPDANTLALYHCDEGSGNVLKDSAAGGHHGTIAGGSWVRADEPPGTASSPSAAARPTTTGFGPWIDLFNGRDLYGWLQKGHAGWSVNDGLLTGESVGAVGWLMSTREFADFELELEYRLPPGGNSGVFLRASDSGNINGADFHEVQLLDDPAPKFSNVDPKGRNGALFGKTAPTKAPIKAANIWRTLRIRALGQRLQVSLDGTEVLDGDLPAGKPGRGHIGLQLYNPGVAFRNIRVRELLPGGSVSGASATSATMGGNFALEFDGVNENQVRIPTLLDDGRGPLTVEAWVRPAKLKDNMGAIVAPGNNNSGPRLHMFGNGFNFLCYEPGKVLSMPAHTDINRNAVFHVAGVRDGQALRIFVDGKLSREAVNTTEDQLPGRTAGYLNIGFSGGGTHFAGVIDEVRISKVARYSKDFTPAKRYAPDNQTLALYHFNEGTGDRLTDYSGNGHHGKIFGAKWVADRASPSANPQAQTPNPQPPPPLTIAPFDAAGAAQHQSDWAAQLSVPVEMTNSVGMKFRLIPPGSFQMGYTREQIDTVARGLNYPNGAQGGLLAAIVPRRETKIDKPFYLGAHEVTQEQFAQFVKETGYVAECEEKGGWSHEGGKAVRRVEWNWKNVKLTPSPDCPVHFVTAKDCRAFCDWLSRKEGRQYALPTTAQSEFASRAGTTTLWFGGDDISRLDDYAWTSSNSGMICHPVGTKLPNPFGLYDMLGNVTEMAVDANGVVGDLSFTSAYHPPWLSTVYCFIRNVEPDWGHTVIGFRVAIVGDFKTQSRQATESSPASSPSSAAATATAPTDDASRTIDLLALVDVKRDGVKGQWRSTVGGINIDGSGATQAERTKQLQLPYTPPEEYDFEIEFTPTAGAYRVSQHFWTAGRSIAWQYDSKMSNQATYNSGFSRLDGKDAHLSPEALRHDSPMLLNGQHHRSRIEVRKNSLRVLLDDKPIKTWQGDFNRFSDTGLNDGLPDPQRLGLITYQRAVTFHKITVREVTGRGKLADGVDQKKQ